MKQPLVCRWEVLFTSTYKCYIWSFLSFWLFLGVYNLLVISQMHGAIDKKTKHGWSNLTNTVINMPDITRWDYKYKTITVLPSSVPWFIVRKLVLVMKVANIKCCSHNLLQQSNKMDGCFVEFNYKRKYIIYSW